MTRVTLLISTLLMASTASAGIISTMSFATEAEAMAAISVGPIFTGHGDTETVQIRDEFSPAEQSVPFDLLQEGQAQAFRFQYNGSGMAEFAIDNIDAEIQPVTDPFVETGFDAILISVFTDRADATMTVDTFDFIVTTGGGFEMDATPASVVTTGENGEAYLLIITDWDLSAGFVMGGEATFSYTGDTPTPSEISFEAAPVLIPEPSSILLLGLGSLMLVISRR